MKILFFSPYFYPYISGITISPKRILDYLKKNNDITVLTFPHNNKLSKGKNINKLNIIRMPYLFKISKGFISPQSIIYFYKYAKEADLIILNQPNFEGLFLAIIAKIFGKKIISIFHCQVFLEGNLLTKIINFALNMSMIIQLHLSNKIVVYTKDYINSLPYFRKLFDKTIDILPPIEYFTADKKFLNKLLKLKKNNIWLGYAGRISSEKGIEYLVEAIKLLNNQNIVLIFAGPFGKDVTGENVYYDKILQLLKKNKINYLFLGNLFKRQLFSFYKSIDVLMLPSINQTEAFGLVQAEAMCVGTPVIASDLPGVRVPVKLTKMGLLVSPKDVSGLQRVILMVLNNKTKYANSLLINKAIKLFNINIIYRFYEKLIS